MTTNNPITIRHRVDSQLLADVMEVAEYNAIDAWADIVVFTKTEDPAMYKMEIIEPSGDPNTGNHHTVTGATILLGMQRIIDLELPDPVWRPGAMITTMSQIRAWIISSIADGDASMVDADVADAIFQYALFNEIVYS
jgi:hypothetical protein